MSFHQVQTRRPSINLVGHSQRYRQEQHQLFVTIWEIRQYQCCQHHQDEILERGENDLHAWTPQ